MNTHDPVGDILRVLLITLPFELLLFLSVALLIVTIVLSCTALALAALTDRDFPARYKPYVVSTLLAAAAGAVIAGAFLLAS